MLKGQSLLLNVKYFSASRELSAILLIFKGNTITKTCEQNYFKCQTSLILLFPESHCWVLTGTPRLLLLGLHTPLPTLPAGCPVSSGTPECAHSWSSLRGGSWDLEKCPKEKNLSYSNFSHIPITCSWRKWMNEWGRGTENTTRLFKLHVSRAVWPQATCLTSLRLSFLIWKMWIITIPTS